MKRQLIITKNIWLFMQYKTKNEEVLIAQDRFVLLTPAFIQTLKQKAIRNKRRRIRICSHKSSSDILHEMFIIHLHDTYVRPHKHLHKSESLTILEGTADIFLFSQDGRVEKVIAMGSYTSGKQFYYRMEQPTYHTMIITSAYLVFYEVTQGPFRKSDAIYAPWSPEENDTQFVKEYMDSLKRHQK